MSTTPLPCPHCQRPVTVHVGYDFTVSCSNCYDWAPDQETASLCASSLMSAEDAIEEWNERVLDAKEAA